MNKFFNIHSSKSRMLLLGVVDIFTIIFNSYMALVLRYEWKYSLIEEKYIDSIQQYMLINIICTIIIFIVLHLYRSVWAFAGVHEIMLIIGACLLSAAFQGLGLQMLQLQIPRSYYILYFFLMVMTTSLTRFSFRVWSSIKRRTKLRKGRRINTMVVGAGEAGSMIVQELKSSKRLNRRVVCIIDDNPSKKGKYLQGVRIVGDRTKIVQAAKKYQIEEIILAIPSASTKVTKEILRICNETNCKLKVLPGMYQLINEEVSVSKLREVSIEDLLGRDSIDIDMASVSAHIKDKVVLVTGGGGSIGSELSRQIAAFQPRHLILFDIYENSVYDVQQELRTKWPKLKLDVLIGSVRNTHRIEDVMKTYRPDLVYHAAAHKHVPLMEDSPNEAIKNNVFGTFKTAKAAGKYGVEHFVLISTDKAVNSTNIMGASKRLCEMVIQMLNNHYNTEYVAVRFGNVLGSNGSVIPLFKRQMESGGPVTVTHKDIIRYFMTIAEAVSLVLQAGAYARGGEIFILDMGEPVKIYDLAKNLIQLSGYTLGVDMDIEVTGLRPGEKLYEEILTQEEGITKTANELIYIGKPLVFDEHKFLEDLKLLEKAANEDRLDIKELVEKIIPGYHIREEDIKRDRRRHVEALKELEEIGKEE